MAQPQRPAGAKQEYVLQERSDVDPHEKLNPEVLGEDLGDGFFLNTEPVFIERGPGGQIVRTTPLSEVTPEMMAAGSTDPKVVDALPAKPKMTTSAKEKWVDVLAGHLLNWYATKKPGQLPYNPLYEGIPASMAINDRKILQPGQEDALVHVSSTEVHEWLRQVLGKRLQIVNTKTGRSGWKGDIQDLAIRINR